MERFRFIPKPHTIRRGKIMMTAMVLVILYLSQTCHGTCQLGLEELTEMCLGLSKSRIPHIEMGLSYVAGSFDGDVRDCPEMCRCAYTTHMIQVKTYKLFIKDCQSDPSRALPKLLRWYKDVHPLVLIFENASLFTFPCEVVALTQLSELYIMGSPMKNISCDLSSMVRLIGFTIRYTRLTDVPSHLFASLPALYYIDLVHNAIKSFSVPLSGLDNLMALLLSENQIDTFPSGVLRLPTLLSLDLGSNNIQKVPALSRLSQLNWLNLSHNPLEIMPSILSDLTKLRCLDLSHTNNILNNETLLPHSLRGLWLSANNITTIRPHSLEWLAVLDMSYNKLTTIPPALYQSTLQRVDLSHNQLDTLCKLYSLSCLDQSHNLIRSIQTSSRDYKGLHTLMLDYNRITHITIVLDFMTQTENLRIGLSHNGLTSLDSWPFRLLEIKPGIKINIDHNPIASFTNHDGASFRACNTIQRGKISLKYNNISHVMDVFSGWNLTGSTAGELKMCIDKVPFSFSGNPLVCDCEDYEIYKHIHGLKSWGLSCSKPARLKGKDPLDIPLDSFICPIHKDCPQGCTCVKSPNTKSIQLLCDHYTTKDLPRVVPKLPRGYKYHLKLTNGNLKMLSLKRYLWDTRMALFSHNTIDHISREVLMVLENIEVVHLDNNLLKRLSDNIMSLTLNSTIELTLSNNPWTCDCQALAMKDWLLANGQKIPDTNSITCHSPRSTLGLKMIHLDSVVFCPNPKAVSVSYILLACAGTLLFLIIPVAIATAIKCRQRVCNTLVKLRPEFRPPPLDECENEQKEFDVYVSYDDEDEEYVLEWLIPELDMRGFKVCFQLLHALPYESVIYNLDACIRKSKRVLVFFSNNLKNSKLALNEWNTAYNMDIHYGTTRLVTILDWDVDLDDLDYTQKQYFEIRGSVIVREDKDFWKNIVQSLAIERMGDHPLVDDVGHDLPEVAVNHGIGEAYDQEL